MFAVFMTVALLCACNNVSAQEESEYFTVSYLATQGGTISGVTTQRIKRGENGTEVTAVELDGYTFIEWSDGVKTYSRKEYDITSDINLTAIYKRLYKVEFSATEGGTVKGYGSYVIEGDDSNLVTAIPNDGYRFVKWSDGLLDAQRQEKEVSKDIYVYAIFERQPVTFKYLVCTSGGGSIEGETTQSIVPNNNGTSVKAVAFDGYIFVGWSDATLESERCDRAAMRDVTYIAYFEPISKNFKLEYNGATGCDSQRSIFISRDNLSTLQFPIPQRDGYKFEGWYVDAEYSLKVANERGFYMLGSYLFSIQTSTFYAKWSIGDDDVPVFRILSFCVEDIFATVSARKDWDSEEYDVDIDYNMCYAEMEFCVLVSQYMQKLLNDWFDGKVRFCIDLYYTKSALARDNLCFSIDSWGAYSWSPDTHNNIYASISELDEIRRDYRVIMTLFDFAEPGLYYAAGTGGRKYAEIYLGRVVGSIKNNSAMSGTDLFDKDSVALNMIVDTCIHEFIHSTEMWIDADKNQYNGAPCFLHEVMDQYNFATSEEYWDIYKRYLLDEEIVGEGDSQTIVGIPFEFWTGEYESPYGPYTSI